MIEQQLFLIAFYTLLLVIGLIILFIPAFIAFQRQHPNRWLIAVICLAFGGTIIGWFGALIWALQAVHRSPTGNHGGESGLNIFANDTLSVRVEPASSTTPAKSVDDIAGKLTRLRGLAEQGAIDAEEHAALRRAILAEI